MWNFFYKMMAKDIVPDFLLRRGIRHLCKQRLRDEGHEDIEDSKMRLNLMLQELRKSPVAIMTDEANEQHYEVPAEFYDLCLGEKKKYSSAYYDTGVQDLNLAEEIMLEKYMERGNFKNGQSILELGCGWGSLTLFMAQKFRDSMIVGVSNSASQREYILSQASQRGLDNIEIITSDINQLEMEISFDRIISIEMFEHMRNYYSLFEKISSWLKDDGQMFVHIFCHKDLCYPFDVKDETDWMSKNFFSGGIMPSEDLFLYFQDHLKMERHWRVNGMHYARTAEDWLKNLDKNRKQALELLSKEYGKENALEKFVQWRVFFMACAELFGFNNGNEWFVSHYLFSKREVSHVNGFEVNKDSLLFLSGA